MVVFDWIIVVSGSVVGTVIDIGSIFSFSVSSVSGFQDSVVVVVVVDAGVVVVVVVVLDVVNTVVGGT